MSRASRRPGDASKVSAQPDEAASQGSADNGESRYSSAPARPEQPLKVHIELRVVHGPEGKQLRIRQAAAIREALRWFAEHPRQDTSEETP